MRYFKVDLSFRIYNSNRNKIKRTFISRYSYERTVLTLKKQIITALIAAALFSVSVTYTFTGFADNTYDDIKVIYDGTELEFRGSASESVNDSAMVPMRAVFEKFGASVKSGRRYSNYYRQKKIKNNNNDNRLFSGI